MPQLEFKEGVVRVEAADEKGGKNRISVEINDPGLYVPHRNWQTSYPIDLIADIARVKGPAWLCDEIMRDEQASYVQRHVQFDIFSYVPAQWFEGKRVLDFGSGCGASTVVLARMLPAGHFVGVELDDDRTAIARRRADHYEFRNTDFFTSPDSKRLPANIGVFDAIILNAVWEHLLPDERKPLLDLLWQHLSPDGLLFVCETPHRYWPVESHTTGIPLLNYMPDRLAVRIARKFSRRVETDTWPELLRRGIRGGSAHEIMGLLRKSGHSAVLLEPSCNDMHDRIDIWYGNSVAHGRGVAKKAARVALKSFKLLTGASIVPLLSLAIKKR